LVVEEGSMCFDWTREHGYQHDAVVTNGDHAGHGRIRVLVADDHMRASSKDHAGAGIPHRRVREAVSVRAEVVNPEIPRHDATIVRIPKRSRTPDWALRRLALAPRRRTLRGVECVKRSEVMPGYTAGIDGTPGICASRTDVSASDEAAE
jgi:hypothetical protein